MLSGRWLHRLEMEKKGYSHKVQTRKVQKNAIYWDKNTISKFYWDKNTISKFSG